MDHDGFCGALEGECSPSSAAEIAQALADLSDDEANAFGAWIALYGDQSERGKWVEQFREDYRGFHDSEADFAREWFEQTSEPDVVAQAQVWPFNEIDWERASVDLFTGGFTSEDALGGVHVFFAR